MSYTEDLLPFLYTPTVGEACQRYHRLPISTYGLYLRATDAGSFLDRLRTVPPENNTAIVVVTDGERILGLGDLGAGGMGISEGKSLLYTAAAGVPPSAILPVCLDVGTSNRSLVQDSAYKGLRRARITGPAYDAIIRDFVSALRAWRPHIVLQFEDFANHNAFHLLEEYRTQLACFNDDVQGTACIALAGLLSALRVEKASLADQRVMFFGAGEAGTGIGELIAFALEKRHGLSREQGRQRCFFMDSKGLVCASRRDLQPHKRPFAHDIQPCATLADAIERVRPTALIGVSTSAGAFTADIMRAMSRLNTRPIIFPLSNPTSKSECTFQEAFDGSDGRVLFASGSPYSSLSRAGKIFTPAQANNAYVFPAIGFAAALCHAREIADDIFLLTAENLASMTAEEDLDSGMLFPRFDSIRHVSCRLMAAIADEMCASGSGDLPKNFEAVTSRPTIGATMRDRWAVYVRAHMFDPLTSPKL